jgi:hypothetical protein
VLLFLYESQLQEKWKRSRKELAISNYDKSKKELFGNGRRKSNSQLFAVEKREVESTKN